MIAIICACAYDSRERNKFGLLEKHKDYILRALAFHQKEHTLCEKHLLSPCVTCGFGVSYVASIRDYERRQLLEIQMSSPSRWLTHEWLAVFIDPSRHEWYRSYRAVHTGPLVDRYMDCPLSGGIVDWGCSHPDFDRRLPLLVSIDRGRRKKREKKRKNLKI
ncbi:hypothetical protein GW17_00010520 [Ensete ventricosum]|nr:hypothetical protein GW17_00010520 [Ensete ventricosum]